MQDIIIVKNVKMKNDFLIRTLTFFGKKENRHCFFLANNMPFFYLANKNQVNLFGVSSFFLNFAEINFDSMKKYNYTSVLGSTALRNSASVIGEG